METTKAPFAIGDVVTVTENVPCCVFKAGDKVHVSNIAHVQTNDGQTQWVVWAVRMVTKAERKADRFASDSRDTIPAKFLVKA
jgi:hypothetical protein